MNSIYFKTQSKYSNGEKCNSLRYIEISQDGSIESVSIHKGKVNQVKTLLVNPTFIPITKDEYHQAKDSIRPGKLVKR